MNPVKDKLKKFQLNMSSSSNKGRDDVSSSRYTPDSVSSFLQTEPSVVPVSYHNPLPVFTSQSTINRNPARPSIISRPSFAESVASHTQQLRARIRQKQQEIRQFTSNLYLRELSYQKQLESRERELEEQIQAAHMRLFHESRRNQCLQHELETLLNQQKIQAQNIVKNAFQYN